MNAIIEDINRIDIVDFLTAIGHLPVYSAGNQCYYITPYRMTDTTPQFQVSIVKNRWIDKGNHTAGAMYELAVLMYEEADPIRVANDLAPFMEACKRTKNRRLPRAKVNLNYTVNPEISERLLSFMKSLGIDPDIVEEECVEIRLRDNGGKAYIGFRNDFGGYVLKAPNIDSSVGRPGITTIEPNYESDMINLFLNFTDYLSFKEIFKFGKLKEVSDYFNYLILNRRNLLAEAIPVLRRYPIINCTLDNNDEGMKIVDYLQSIRDGVHSTVNLYTGFADLNEFLVKDILPKRLVEVDGYSPSDTL